MPETQKCPTGHTCIADLIEGR